MSPVRFQNSKFIFSTLLLITQLKVSTNSDAVPLQNVFNLESLSIEEPDHDSFSNLPYLLLEAATRESSESQPKTCAIDRLKIMAAEVAQKMNDFYDLLLEAELIEVQETEHRRPEDFDHLAARDIESGTKDSSDGPDEFSAAREEFSDSLEEPLLDKPKPMNAGQKVKKMAKDVADKVKEMFEKMKKPKDDQPEKESLGARTKKMFSNTGKKIKKIYDESIVKRFKKLFAWKFQLDVEVKPLALSAAKSKSESKIESESQSESEPELQPTE